MCRVIPQETLAEHSVDADQIARLIPLSGFTITHMAVGEERGKLAAWLDQSQAGLIGCPLQPTAEATLKGPVASGCQSRSRCTLLH